jgi:Holliday junction DNA helicase RuvA
MIAKIRGTIEFLRDNYAVIDVNGVGYKVFITAHTFGKIAHLATEQIDKKDAELYTHTYVREDTLALYGFLDQDELEMFELLISISGIGPKAAMGILAIADPKTIRTAVLNEDSSILTRVSGIGKKIAQRVILELKNKVADMPMHEKKQISEDSDALEALAGMGYSISQAREALKIIPSDVKDVGQRIKLALKNLGKK